MKKTATLIGFIIIALSLRGQIQAQTFLTNGLVGYYPFDGNANDASGNANNLMNFGATPCADRFGNSNQAYFFNGSAYLGSSISPLSQTDNWTVTAWIRPASLPQAGAFAVCVGGNSGSTFDGFAMGISGGIGNGSSGPGQPGNLLYFFYPGSGFNSDDYSFSSTNEWHQVVMLRSSGTLVMYVDGAFTTNSEPTLPSNYGEGILEPTALEIGSGGSAQYFNGAVDDVRIYNLPLTPNEVQQLYAYESSPEPPQPCIPYPASASLIVTNGFVIGATVTDSGCGYTNTPLVTIVGGGGSGATATAIITNGEVVGITITDAGNGYISMPTAYIASPLGVQIGIIQAVIPTFSGLSIGSNYQLQASSDLNLWTNQGTAFTATNFFAIYPQYFNVTGWGQLYFRLQAVP